MEGILKFKKRVVLLCAVLGMASPVAAKSPAGNVPEGQKFVPIEMQLQIFGKMKYSVSGVELHGYKPFEDIINPLNDSMASYSLKNARSEDAASWAFLLAGFTAEVVGVVDAISRYDVSQNTGAKQDYTVDWVIGGGGILLNGLGALLQGQAQVDKFNAVQRYNHVVRGEDKVSLLFSPEKKRLELNFAERF